MCGMKRSVKTALIIVAVALLACLVVLFVLRSRRDDAHEAFTASVPDTSRGPSFEVRVVVPRTGLPFGGILPDSLVKKFDGTPREMRFDHTSPGAQIGNVAPDRLGLTADGWDLSIETDVEGHITRGTHLVFNLGLGGNKVKLRCRPANPGIGQVKTTLTDSGLLGGRFLLELATCENAESGKVINWPPAPLTVHGSFVGPPHGRR